MNVECIKKVINNVDNIKLKPISNKTWKSLDLLFNDICKKWKSLHITLKPSIIKSSLPDTPFIGNKLKKEIKKYEGEKHYLFRSRKIDLIYFGNYEDNVIEDLMKRAIITYDLVNPDHKGVIIKIIPTLCKKELNGVGTDQVNSGSSLIFVDGISEISIWRKEELGKVLVHEMIHAVCGDHAIYINNIGDCNIYNWLKIGKKMINVNETFTEITANLLNVFYVACSLGNPWNQYFSAERGFSQIQAKKILNKMGYEKFSDLKKGNRYKQETSIVAYYLLRAGVMFLYDDYFKLMGDDIFCFNPSKLNGFLEIIKKGCSQMSLEDIKIDDNSGRMSCIEKI
jgi:hypothetical protein